MQIRSLDIVKKFIVGATTALVASVVAVAPAQAHTPLPNIGTLQFPGGALPEIKPPAPLQLPQLPVIKPPTLPPEVAKAIGLPVPPKAPPQPVKPAPPVPPAPPAPPVWSNEGTWGTPISQGSMFKSTTGQTCTIGFIDPVRRIAYSAQHCNPANRADLMKTNGEHLGKAIYNAPLHSPVDVMAIQLDKHVPIANIPHAHAFIGPLKPGDRVCYTGGRSGLTDCGPLDFNFDGGFVGFPVNKHPIPGDSGSVIWVPGKGTVGILSGFYGQYGVAEYGVAFSLFQRR